MVSYAVEAASRLVRPPNSALAPRRRSSLIMYRAGTSNSTMMVEKLRPQTIASAMGAIHAAASLSTRVSGNKPATVDKVVSMTGRKRRLALMAMAYTRSVPRARVSLMKCTRSRESLTTMPPNAMTPNNAMNVSGLSRTKKPATTPIKLKGIANSTTNGWVKALEDCAEDRVHDQQRHDEGAKQRLE